MRKETVLAGALVVLCLMTIAMSMSMINVAQADNEQQYYDACKTYLNNHNITVDDQWYTGNSNTFAVDDIAQLTAYAQQYNVTIVHYGRVWITLNTMKEVWQNAFWFWNSGTVYLTNMNGGIAS